MILFNISHLFVYNEVISSISNTNSFIWIQLNGSNSIFAHSKMVSSIAIQH